MKTCRNLVLSSSLCIEPWLFLLPSASVVKHRVSTLSIRNPELEARPDYLAPSILFQVPQLRLHLDRSAMSHYGLEESNHGSLLFDTSCLRQFHFVTLPFRGDHLFIKLTQFSNRSSDICIQQQVEFIAKKGILLILTSHALSSSSLAVAMIPTLANALLLDRASVRTQTKLVVSIDDTMLCDLVYWS